MTVLETEQLSPWSLTRLNSRQGGSPSDDNGIDAEKLRRLVLVVGVLAERGDRLSVGSAGAVLGIAHPQFVKKYINHAVDRQLVAETRGSKDKRTKYLIPGPAALEFADDAIAEDVKLHAAKLYAYAKASVVPHSVFRRLEPLLVSLMNEMEAEEYSVEPERFEGDVVLLGEQQELLLLENGQVTWSKQAQVRRDDTAGKTVVTDGFPRNFTWPKSEKELSEETEIDIAGTKKKAL